MFNSLAESLIKKYCGRFLKNFGSSNVSVGVTGTLRLFNIEFRTEELEKFQLPYKPIRAFIGELSADLPFVLGGNFDIKVKDLFILFEKDDDKLEFDPIVVQTMLQSFISIFYFSYIDPTSTGSTKTLSGAELENNQKLLDRFIATLENIHLRVEEPFTSANVNYEDTMCSGIMIERFEVRPFNSSEKQMYGKELVTPNRKVSLVINKLVKCSNFSVYCSRDPCLALDKSEMLTLAMVQKLHEIRKEAFVLSPWTFQFVCSGGFQKTTCVFGPIVVDFSCTEFKVELNDDQFMYLYAVVRKIHDDAYKLQAKARLAFSRSPMVSDRRRIARLRWDLIRQSIKIDWWRYGGSLHEGAIKWRCWFETWRLAARYVALREILMFHVGYESYSDKAAGVVMYNLRENLVQYYDQNEFNLSEDERIIQNSFIGKGNFTDEFLAMAQELVEQQMFSHIHPPPVTEDGSRKYNRVNPFTLSTMTIRALYALQLELDAQLPFKISAYCRLHAEDKYKMRTGSLNSSTASGRTTKDSKNQLPVFRIEENANEIEYDLNPYAEVKKHVLFVSPIDAAGMTPSFGASKVTSYVTMQSDNWHHGGPLATTETISVKVPSQINTGFGIYGDMYSLTVDPNLFDASAASSADGGAAAGGVNQVITVECCDKSFLWLSYGTHSINVQKTMSEQIAEVAKAKAAGSVDAVSAIVAHDITLQKTGTVFAQSTPAPSNGAAAQPATPVTMKVLTMVAYGAGNELQAASNKFQARVKEYCAERKTILERRQQLEINENFNKKEGGGSAGSEALDDETFILDPNVITMQDLQFKGFVPKISITFSANYGIPVLTRSLILENHGEEIPKEVLLPILNISVHRIQWASQSSNNPWFGEGVGSIDKITVELLQQEPSADGSPQFPLDPIISIPKISGTLSMTQISTLSRNISKASLLCKLLKPLSSDQHLDISCFDFHSTVRMFPFTILMHPQTLYTEPLTNDEHWVQLWKSHRPLQHLWLPSARWAKGNFSGCINSDGKPPPKLKSEATLRLGDAYTLFPKYLNVCKELWSAVTMQPSPSNGEEYEFVGGKSKEAIQREVLAGMPTQKTTLKCIAPVRTLDIDLTLKPTKTEQVFVDRPAPVSVAHAASTETIHSTKSSDSNNPFLNWFGAGHKDQSVSAPAPAPVVNGSASGDCSWQAEKAALLKRIEELEAQNRLLQKANNGSDAGGDDFY